MKASDRLAQRHPLAWGMVRWGPLPDTADLFLFWGGPESGLYLEKGVDGPQRRIMHSSASGVYGTVAAAERAVSEFVKAGIT